MNIYLDESGDLGWKFDDPYRAGGSSRFLTIGHVFVAPSDIKQIGRFVRSIYKSRNRPARVELKAANLDATTRMLIARTAVQFIQSGIIQIRAITVKKQNVEVHIRENQNVIYNYMVKECIFKEIEVLPEVHLLPDNRSIRVQYANSLEMYLKTMLFERRSQTMLTYSPQESDKNLQVQFADYITNIIWRRYEVEDAAAYQTLHPYISHRLLFARPRRGRAAPSRCA